MIEGRVIPATVVAIEHDFVVVDIGLKTEGRIPLREFLVDDGAGAPKAGDIVEVYLDRIENALGDAVVSREKARREEAWTRLEKNLRRARSRQRRARRPREGRLHRRSRRRQCVLAGLAKSTSARCATSAR